MKMLFKDGKRKAVTLSYDDGVVQDIRLIDIMNKYGLKGTFNLNSGKFTPEECETVTKPTGTTNDRLKLSEAAALYKNSGHEIAVHGLEHLKLINFTAPEITYEISADRVNLEKEFGTIVNGMAYAYGTYNDSVIDSIKKCGIVYSRTVLQTEKFRLPENWISWHPTCHHNHPALMELAKKFIEVPLSEQTCELSVFYLWGHSYEFDRDNNWNVIEEFSEYIGKREDIWYATNKEIYDYVTAYKRLELSMNSKIAYNPTNLTLWARVNGTVCEIKPGETVEFRVDK